MVRTLRGALFAGVLGGVMAVAGYGLAADGQCNVATKGDSPVAQACQKGGIKEAKKVMKEMSKKAKAGGVKFECDDCHKDDTKYDLTDDAKDKFKKMLAAIK
jgi:hypothetical protein